MSTDNGGYPFDHSEGARSVGVAPTAPNVAPSGEMPGQPLSLFRMSEAEFKAYMGRDCPNGWGDLAPWLEVEPCDCGEDYCTGWQSRYKRDYHQGYEAGYQAANGRNIDTERGA